MQAAKDKAMRERTQVANYKATKAMYGRRQAAATLPLMAVPARSVQEVTKLERFSADRAVSNVLLQMVRCESLDFH
jgi:hypothetical protein